MLLDDTGLKINAFDSILATVFGKEKGEEGCRVLSEAIRHGRSKVHLPLAILFGEGIGYGSVPVVGSGPWPKVRDVGEYH